MAKGLTVLSALLLFQSGLSCHSGRTLQRAEPAEAYEAFYQRFHRDSLFQLSRLAQPLGGYKIEGQSVRPWDQVPWVMHKQGKGHIDESIYQIEITRSDSEIKEVISLPQSTFLIERHFSLKNGHWFLEYCLEIFL